MAAYAEGTKVPVEKTVGELVQMIRRYGGAQIAQLDDLSRFVLAFTLEDRQVRFTVNFDPPMAERFASKPVNQHQRTVTSPSERIAMSEAHRRQRMRALLLVVKAKFESIESEVETFEQAFLANVVMSDGKTVYDRISGDMALEYRQGKPSMFLIAGPKDFE